MGDFAGLVPAASQGQMAERFYTQERCYISEYMNTPEAAAVSLALCTVAPGVTTQLHSLTVEERYIIVQGRGVMELAESETFLVNVGDVVIIPAGVAQRIRNVLEEDLNFLCVCTPRFQPEHYRVLETEQTQPLDIVL
ncbi:MAG: cupin domain-containing protein [Pseudomonadales bacterium]|jgi:mannose-6-phosphate isomerase-like protein (cupin superfamily)|nr:cupin domain-containing protein [Pseudomonadales bacterium]